MGLEGAPAAETEWGGLLSRYAVERLACSSALRRVVMDSKSVVIDMWSQGAGHHRTPAQGADRARWLLRGSRVRPATTL